VFLGELGELSDQDRDSHADHHERDQRDKVGPLVDAAVGKGGSNERTRARTLSATPVSAGRGPPSTALAMTSSRAENRNPPSTSDDRNGNATSASSAGPATARAHAVTRRVGDRCLSHAPVRRPSALTTLSVTDDYRA